MDHRYFFIRLEHNAFVIENLVRGVSTEQASWKPAPDKWSILEVINHLYDEERDDFRQRVDLTLHCPGETWPGIDPPAWAVNRKYNERDFEESLQNFLRERRASIEWLEGLASPNWTATYQHPQAGELSAENMLACWVAHDLLHIRQITALHWVYFGKLATPYSFDYAGTW